LCNSPISVWICSLWCLRCSFSSLIVFTKGIMYWIANSNTSSGDSTASECREFVYESILVGSYNVMGSRNVRSMDGWGPVLSFLQYWKRSLPSYFLNFWSIRSFF
jgi:hypothetical protein